MSRRFQFSLKRLLASVGLLAVALVCVKAAAIPGREATPFALFAILVAIGASIGALSGEALSGAIAGSLVAFVLIVAMIFLS